MSSVQCEYCVHRMPRESLRKHWERKHTIECLLCDSNVIASSITKHILAYHEDYELGEDLENLQNRSFERGRRKCFEEFHVTCTVCEVKLLKTSLDEHMKNAHPPPRPVHIPFIQDVVRPLLRQSASNLYQHERTADAFFIFENQCHVVAHKSILASDSAVFYRMFYGNLKETGEVTIADASSEGFLVFLESFYKSQMAITEENVAELMYLGNKYDATKCTKACEDFLALVLRTENVLTILELSITYNSEPLRQLCVKEIEKTGNAIIQMDNFHRSNRDVLKQILSIDFQGRNELTVYEACIEWAKHSFRRGNVDDFELSQLRSQLGDCFDLIRLNSMSPLQFVQLNSRYAEMFKKEELTEISKTIAAQYVDSPETPYPVMHDLVKAAASHSPTTIQYSFAKIENLFENEQTADVFFVLEGTTRIPAHKCVLACYSPKFDEMLYGPEKDNTVEIHVRQGCADDFSVFLQSFYGKVMPLSMANIATVMHFGGEYDAQICLIDCEHFLLSHLSDENVFLAFELSHLHRRPTLYKSCVQKIEKHYEFLFGTNAFLQCSRETVKHVVMIDFEDHNSVVIFEACMKWARHFCETTNINTTSENLVEALRDILNLIRFTSMTIPEFIKCQKDYDGIFNTDRLKHILIAIGDSK